MLWIAGLLLVVSLIFAFSYYAQLFESKPELWRNGAVAQEHYDIAYHVGALEAGETIRCFYKSAESSLDEWFCMVTDRRVVLFDGSDPDRSVNAIELVKIDDFSMLSIMESSIYLTDDDGNKMTIIVSRDNSYDRKLYNSIANRMKEAGNAPGADWKDVLDFIRGQS